MLDVEGVKVVTEMCRYFYGLPAIFSSGKSRILLKLVLDVEVVKVVTEMC